MYRSILSASAIAATALVLVACGLERDGAPVVVDKLNQSVGQRFEDTDWGNVSTASIRSQHGAEIGERQYDYTWKNGCAVRLTVAENGRIKGWVYLSRPALCAEIRGYRFGA